MKNIIVVADKDLKSFGRALVHAISSTKIAKASLFTPKQYADNEHQIGGTQYAIFLGKNEVSKDFIPLIQKKYEKHGIVWGYDASKAVIYIESSDLDLDIFLREIHQVEKDIIRRIYPNSPNFELPDHDIVVRPIIARRNRLKETIALQLILGIKTFLFLEDGFHEFVMDEHIQR